MNLFLDTSCLVSFFASDVHSQKAVAIMSEIVNGETQGLISALSLAELCGAIRRRTDEATAKQVKNDLTGLNEKGLISIIPVMNSDAFSASDLAISTGLKGADAIIVSAAKQNQTKLVTFDEEIMKKAKPVVEFHEL